MTGMKVTWIKGPRTLVTGKDQKGKDVVRTGKNGGPCIQQVVTQVFSPKGH